MLTRISMLLKIVSEKVFSFVKLSKIQKLKQSFFRSHQSSRKPSITAVTTNSNTNLNDANDNKVAKTYAVEPDATVDTKSFKDQFNKLPRNETFLFNKQDSKMDVLISVESADERKTFSLKTAEADSESEPTEDNKKFDSLRSFDGSESQKSTEDLVINHDGPKLSPAFSINVTEPTPTTIVKVSPASANKISSAPKPSGGGSHRVRQDSLSEITKIKGDYECLKQALEGVVSQEASFNASLDEKIASMPERATRKITPKRLTMSDYIDRSGI